MILHAIHNLYLLCGWCPPVQRPSDFCSLQKINLKYPTEVGERIWGSNCFLQTFERSSCSQSLPHLHFWMYLLCPIPESLAVLPCKKLSAFCFPTACLWGFRSLRSAKSVASPTDALQVPTLCCCYLFSVLSDLVVK